MLKYKKPMDITNKTWLLWSSSRCDMTATLTVTTSEASISVNKKIIVIF